MSNAQPKGKDWSTDRKGAYSFVFETHRWGDSTKSGKGPNGGYQHKERPKKTSKERVARGSKAPVVTKGKK